MKVFWSWQSDRIPKNHHYFVRDALKRACEIIVADAEIDESDRPEVDHDTKDVPGTPDIVKAIAEKIDEASAFVADMTPVAMTDPGALRPDLTAEKRQAPKYVQNPNVMSELGYAEKSLTLKRIVLVANAAHYPGPVALPFDWRNRRGAETYNLADDADNSARKAELERFAQQLSNRLSPILLAKSANRVLDDHLPKPSADDVALWEGAQSGIEFKEGVTDHLKRIVLDTGPRLYVKIIPSRWNAIPTAVLEKELTGGVRLWIRGGSGTFGRSGDGAVSAQDLIIEETGNYCVGTLTFWFQESGAIWAVDTTSFGLNEHGHYFAYQTPIAHIARLITNGVAALKRHGGMGPFKIELGCTNLKGVVWAGNVSFQRSPALKEIVKIERSSSDWTAIERRRFLFDFWNKLLETFGWDPVKTVDEFQRGAAVSLSEKDEDEE